MEVSEEEGHLPWHGDGCCLCAVEDVPAADEPRRNTPEVFAVAARDGSFRSVWSDAGPDGLGPPAGKMDLEAATDSKDTTTPRAHAGASSPQGEEGPDFDGTLRGAGGASATPRSAMLQVPTRRDSFGSYSAPTSVPPLFSEASNVLSHADTVGHLGSFKDVEIVTGSAGFVSYRPITMLFRRWPIRIVSFVVALYFSGIAAGYATEFGDSVAPSAPLWLAVVSAAAPGLCCWVAPVLAWLGRPKAAARVFGAGFVAYGLLCSPWIVLSAVAGRYLLAAYHLLTCCARVAVGLMLLFREHWWWHVTVANCFMLCTVTIVFAAAFDYLHALLTLAGAVGGLGFALVFTLWRAKVLHQVQLESKPDQVRYELVWEQLKRDKAEQLDLLASVVRARSSSNCRARQPSWSLQEIYELGNSLNDWYQDVVAEWASACGARSLRVAVKSLQRTLEKVHRSYRGKIPWLTDIVRSAIVVEVFDDMKKVLEHVLAKAEVQHIKNRFDPSYNAEVSAGYRDLNLTLTFHELRGSRFDGFMFELQIHYAPILALKDNQGHRRYTQVRNLRGD